MSNERAVIDDEDRHTHELESELEKLRHDAEAWRKGWEMLQQLRERVIPCGHKVEDLIGGDGSVTKCGACLAERQAKIDSQDKSDRKIVGYRLRYVETLTGATRWYAPAISTSTPTEATTFETKTAAIKCLATLNDGWTENAEMVPVYDDKLTPEKETT